LFDLNADEIKYSSAELCGKLAKKVAEKKVSKDFGVTFVKGIGCNWMVCMAVFLSGQAQDMAGKMVGIWFPISCFVAIGFEHIPANMYMIPLGLLAGADVTIWEVIWKNFIPTTLGNIFAGSIIVACGYSYSFGALGKPKEQKTSEASSRRASDSSDTPLAAAPAPAEKIKVTIEDKPNPPEVEEVVKTKADPVNEAARDNAQGA